MGNLNELDAAAQLAARKLIDDLTVAAKAVTGADFDKTSPRPEGALRVTPTF